MNQFEQIFNRTQQALGWEPQTGREVRKYWETDEHIVGFCLLLDFVDFKKNME